MTCRKRLKYKNESDICVSETESSNSSEPESGDNDSKDDFTSEWSKKLKN